MTTTTIHSERTKHSPTGQPGYWLFTAPMDLGVFLGSALVSLGALAAGHYLGVLHQETPEWAWVPFILLIDVAHVYATGFRVYFDRRELRRRPLLYAGVPIAGFILGVALYSESETLFWRVLAYLAVFHFVRQQYGWVALYRAKRRETVRWEKYLDVSTIYAATVYPLIYWHGHLPRNYAWFLRSDFEQIPRLVSDLATPVYWLLMAAYALKSIHCWRLRRGNPGKDIVVATTAVCWYVGIVSFNSDYAFTVTNVVIHGVPYMALVYWYMKNRRAQIESDSERQTDAIHSKWWSRVVLLLSTTWLLAYVEELIWDRGIWNERSWLFGSAFEAGNAAVLLVPLLAVPQLTHYVLDGFIWRRRSNPDFKII